MSNEPIPENQSNSSTPIATAIEQAAQQVSARHELHAAGAETGQGAPLGSPPGLGTHPGSNAGEIFSKSVAALIRSFDGYMGRRLARAAWTLTQDKGFVNNLVSEAAITDEELSSIGELSTIVAAKYSLLTLYAPEFGLACLVIGYGSRIVHATRKIEEMARERKNNERKEQKP